MKRLPLSLLPLLLISSFFSWSHRSHAYPLNDLSLMSQTLALTSRPYITTLSLGDPLYTDGLVVSRLEGEDYVQIEDYTLSGYDASNLGVQTVLINADSLSTSFEVYVTNKGVNHSLIVGNEVILSELIYLSEDEIGLELFNNSATTRQLDGYSIAITYEDEENLLIDLSSYSVAPQTTLSIAHNLASETLKNKANIITPLLLENASSIAISKSNIIVDHIDVQETSSFFNEDASLQEGVIRRHPRSHLPHPHFEEKAWVFTHQDISDFATHETINTIVSYEEQAKAFARYVMYGAGMFAAGRVEEAFLSLKNEWDKMSTLSRQYFINNKDVEVSGINEEGKSDTATFSEAHGRISVLASRSGHTSFIPSGRFTFNLGETGGLLLVGGLLLLSLTGYFFIRFKFKKT